ncbi:MAG: BrnT family toxin [Pseudomonadota bacterium]
MKFECDPRKEAANRAKHGIGFDLAVRLNWRTASELRDTRLDYSEIRRQAFVYFGDRLYVCIYTQRGDAKRIIPLR